MRRAQTRLITSAITMATIGLAGLTACGVAAADEGDAGKEVAESASSAPERPADGERGDRQRGDRDILLTDDEAAAITVDADIVYREVDGTEVELDVCTAPDADEPRAAVVLIHGGAFAAGDKDRPQWQAICRWLAHEGYVAVNVNYRLAPENQFPAAFEDVQAAVEWTRANADTYGIDPARVGALGGSAGANLAQLLGTSGEGSTTEGSRVSSVVSLSGASDLTEEGLALGDPTPEQIAHLLDYLGCETVEDCPSAAEASPITHIDSTDPPILLAHARADRLPVQQSERMADALTDAGVDSELLIRPGRAHATLLLISERNQDAVLDFLSRTLG